MLQETWLRTENLIAPLFIKPGTDKITEIDSMPGISRHSIESLIQECESLLTLGIKAIALFPCTPPELKNPMATAALDANGLVVQALKALKTALPELVVITDIALDPFTSHGHDGVLDSTGCFVDNDATVKILTQMALLHAESGADWVAPSDMMDGRILAIREELDDKGFINTGILAYSAKFASAYYGPFRDAIGSGSAAGKTYLDKGTYQLNPANQREAATETHLDEEEGADILMVKPAGPYLDIISNLRKSTHLPIAAYQVSGEYAQIHAAARLGWLDLQKVRDESLLSIKRAGADLILTYFARDVAQSLKSK